MRVSVRGCKHSTGPVDTFFLQRGTAELPNIELLSQRTVTRNSALYPVSRADVPEAEPGTVCTQTCSLPGTPVPVAPPADCSQQYLSALSSTLPQVVTVQQFKLSPPQTARGQTSG